MQQLDMNERFIGNIKKNLKYNTEYFFYKRFVSFDTFESIFKDMFYTTIGDLFL